MEVIILVALAMSCILKFAQLPAALLITRIGYIVK